MPETCLHCGKDYTSYKTMRDHVRKVHPEYFERKVPSSGVVLPYGEFPCPHCDKVYALEGYLRNHRRDKHRREQVRVIKDNLPVSVPALPVSNGKVELHDEPDLIIRVDQHGDPWICRKVNLA